MFTIPQVKEIDPVGQNGREKEAEPHPRCLDLSVPEPRCCCFDLFVLFYDPGQNISG